MSAPDYTEDYRQELRRRGRKSLYFFGTAILGFDHYEESYGRSILAPLHRDLCHFLEGRPPYKPWSVALVVAFRGAGKSIWTDVIYPLWRDIHIDSFTWKLVENSSNNAKVNHFIPIITLFTESRRAQFLQWLYREEIPDGFKGWTTQQLAFRQDHPEAGPSLSYWGMDTRWEGTHPRGITLDDLEGAEAERSDINSEEAWSAFEDAFPLLADQSRGQMLVVGTPHGNEPFVWRVRESGIPDAIFWRPLLDEDESYGSCQWPEKFPEDAVARLKKMANWDQQYMLRKRSRKTTFFDMGVIRDSCYKRDPYDRLWVTYPSVKVDPNKVDQHGHVHPEPVPVSVNLRALRYFIHFDPSHKSDEQARKQLRDLPGTKQAAAAVVAVGIAEDMHGLIVEYKKKAGMDLNQQAQLVFEFYRRFAAWLVVCEPVGAQRWFRSHVEAMEKARPDWRYPMSFGPLFGDPPLELPPMSSRLIFSEKPPHINKENLIAERLSPWFNGRLLHAPDDKMGDGLFYEMEHIGEDTLDLLDALAQGPGRIPSEQRDGRPVRSDAGKMVWSAPMPREYSDQLRQRQKATEYLKDPRTGWRPFWQGQ